MTDLSQLTDAFGTLATATQAALAAVAARTAPAANRALGVYVHNSQWNFALLDAYALRVRGMPTFATSYHEWVSTNGDDGERFPTYPAGYAPQMSMLDAFAARDITPILTWQSFADWKNGADPNFALSTILSGAHDAQIAAWVAAAKAYGKPLYIRFDHEMNGDWYPWGQGVNGNTPAQFVAAWKYVVNKFRSGGATNVRWVWSPAEINVDPANGFPAGQYPLTGLYPGDAYVDMVGMDGYNFGTSGQGTAGWRSFTTVFGATYAAIRALAPSKPIYIAETNCAEAGGDKAAWITSAFLTEIPASFPALIGVVWFDAFGTFDPLWAITTSPSALSAYRQVVATPTWAAVLP